MGFLANLSDGARKIIKSFNYKLRCIQHNRLLFHDLRGIQSQFDKTGAQLADLIRKAVTYGRIAMGLINAREHFFAQLRRGLGRTALVHFIGERGINVP
jgi:hypothetical protein